MIVNKIRYLLAIDDHLNSSLLGNIVGFFENPIRDYEADCLKLSVNSPAQ